MPARIAPVLLAALAVVALAGCAASAPSSTAPSFTPVAQAPRPTPIAAPTLTPDAPRTPAPTATPEDSPVVGDVDGSAGGPELTVEDLDADTVQVTLVDPSAKAWRLVIAGTGARAGDRWEIEVETSDIDPVITATEIRGGKTVDELDLSGFADGTAAAGGCHPSLAVCLDSDGFSLPTHGDGAFSARLDLQGAAVPLTIRGGTAGWPAEPFVLGPWTDTEAFPWGG
jgi:hypothetical protein